jgi:hypothetical protein
VCVFLCFLGFAVRVFLCEISHFHTSTFFPLRNFISRVSRFSSTAIFVAGPVSKFFWVGCCRQKMVVRYTNLQPAAILLLHKHTHTHTHKHTHTHQPKLHFFQKRWRRLLLLHPSPGIVGYWTLCVVLSCIVRCVSLKCLYCVDCWGSSM